MNSNGILTKATEIMKMEPQYYVTPREEGEFEFDLDFRIWYKDGIALVCYGCNYENHQLIQLFAWRRDVDGKTIYAPKESDVDMSKVKDGSLWKVTTRKNAKGKVEWRTAEFIEDIDDPETIDEEVQAR